MTQNRERARQPASHAEPVLPEANPMFGEDTEQIGNLFRFEQGGDEITGTIKRIEAGVKMRQGTTSRYTITRDNDGEEFVVLGTALINQKLASAEAGDYVRLFYDGTTTPTQNGNMKNIRAWVIPASEVQARRAASRKAPAS